MGDGRSPERHPAHPEQFRRNQSAQRSRQSGNRVRLHPPRQIEAADQPQDLRRAPGSVQLDIEAGQRKDLAGQVKIFQFRLQGERASFVL